MNMINSMNASKYLCSTMPRTFVREHTNASYTIDWFSFCSKHLQQNFGKHLGKTSSRSRNIFWECLDDVEHMPRDDVLESDWFTIFCLDGNGKFSLEMTSLLLRSASSSPFSVLHALPGTRNARNARTTFKDFLTA